MLTDEQLRRGLHELRETPSEDFAAELDGWAAAGFPSAREADASADSRIAFLGERLRRRRPLMPMLAGAATIVLAVTIGIALVSQEGLNDRLDQTEDLSRDGGGTAPPSAEDSDSALEREPAPGGDAGSTSTIEPAPTTVPPVPPTPREELRPNRERVQERSASMTLSTDAGDVDDVADAVVEVAERYEGIVVSSEVSRSGERGRANFDLRIPSASLQSALADLSDLASVSARNEGTLDITAPFVAAQERFEDAEAEVEALLERLEDAGGATEIASLREHLRTARAELAAARAELGNLKQRSDFSRLAVIVLGEGDADGWSLDDAAGDAVSVLEDIAGAALVALAVLLPLALLALFGRLGARELGRRRRESALDD